MRNQKISQIAATLTILAALGFGLGLNDARAQDDVTIAPLDRKLAIHLIADFYEIGENEVKVAYILDGKLKHEQFETERGAEVTFIRPVVQDGRRRRLVHSIRFQHDETLGWFLKEIVEDDGRDYIEICSEFKGRIRIE